MDKLFAANNQAKARSTFSSLDACGPGQCSGSNASVLGMSAALGASMKFVLGGRVDTDADDITQMLNM